MTATSPRRADYPIEPIFLERWSPRAFGADAISDADLHSVFEAARWAPSASNMQPWRFFYARRDTPAFATFLGLLVPGNQAWAKNAAALMILASQKSFIPPGKSEPVESRTHSFDAGAAWGFLALQALRLGYVTHAMAGFDVPRAASELGMPENYSTRGGDRYRAARRQVNSVGGSSLEGAAEWPQPTIGFRVRGRFSRTLKDASRRFPISRKSASAQRGRYTCAHQESIDRVRRLAPFADRPDDQRLAAPHVAAGEHIVGAEACSFACRRRRCRARSSFSPSSSSMPSCTGETKPIASSTRSALSVEFAARESASSSRRPHAVDAVDDAVLAVESLWSAPRNRAPRLPHGSTRCAASAASSARSAACLPPPAASA